MAGVVRQPDDVCPYYGGPRIHRGPEGGGYGRRRRAVSGLGEKLPINMINDILTNVGSIENQIRWLKEIGYPSLGIGEFDTIVRKSKSFVTQDVSFKNGLVLLSAVGALRKAMVEARNYVSSPPQPYPNYEYSHDGHMTWAERVRPHLDSAKSVFGSVEKSVEGRTKESISFLGISIPIVAVAGIAGAYVVYRIFLSKGR